VPHAAIRIGMAPRLGGRSSTHAADMAEAASRVISGNASTPSRCPYFGPDGVDACMNITKRDHTHMRLWKALRAAPHAPHSESAPPIWLWLGRVKAGYSGGSSRKNNSFGGARPPEYGWTMAVPTIHLRGGVLVGPDTELGKLTQPRL
jgi:hypothetical protein